MDTENIINSGLESIASKGKTVVLSNLSLQPLYRSLRNLPVEQVGELLPSLSKEQRQLLLDVDLWEKDSLDVYNFEFWLKAYSRCQDEKVILNFCQSLSFQLYLKSRFNIHTFDVEDPHYPEHDNYFLTEDNLLLFEFHEDYSYVSEIKLFILNLYSQLGVEKAYTFLFKTVIENFSSFQECEYEDKKRRLSEQGFVDYYESLEVENCYPSIELMDAAIEKMTPTQTLASRTYQVGIELLPFWNYAEGMKEEMEQVASRERRQYLEFNFIYLVNASLVFNGVFKSSDPEEWEKVGSNISNLVLLGRSYLEERFSLKEVLLERFDFLQIYKIGNTLVKIVQKRLERVLSHSDISESFRGNFWNEFLKNSLEHPCQFSGKSINDMKIYREWMDGCEIFFGLFPFMKTLHKTWKKLLAGGQIQSSFYLNYTVEEIDFEIILISSFANYQLKSLKKKSHRKIGLTLKEFRLFVEAVVDEKGKLRDLKEDRDSFLTSYGLGHIPNIGNYFENRLRIHMEDVDYKSLAPKDYKHLSGPIVFVGTMDLA